jgi:hypothetical protein
VSWLDSIKRLFRPDPAPPGSVIVVKEHEVPGHFGWTQDQVQAALEAIDSGQLLGAEQLLVAMTRDPVFRHGINTRVQAQTSVPFCFSRFPSLPERYYQVLVEHWPVIFSAATQATTAKYRVTIGVAPAAVTWWLDPTGEVWLPKVHARKAGHLTWYQEIERYKFQPKSGEQIIVQPDGDEWLLFTEMAGLLPHLEGAERALAAFWWMKHAVARHWFSYAKTHGSATRKVKVPGKQRENEDVRALVQTAVALFNGAVVVLPQYGEGQPSFDFELLEAKAATWETFPEFLAMVDRYITLLLVGALDNTQGSDAGSRARAEVHERVSLRYLAADCKVTAAPLTLLLQRWAIHNGLPLAAAPQPIFDWQPPEDRKAAAEAGGKRASALQAAASGLAQLDQLASKPDYDPAHVLKQCGITLMPEPQDAYQSPDTPR